MDLEQEAANIKVDTSILGDISEACNKLLNAQKQISEAEDNLKTIKEKARVLKEQTIPDLMSQAGMKKVVLEDDSIVEVKSYPTAKITKEKKDKAHEWLRSNNLGNIIKNQVVLKFPTSEDDIASKLCDEMKQRGHHVEQLEKVEWQTLNSTVREQERLGDPMPTDLFSVYQVTDTKITTKKEKL